MAGVLEQTLSTLRLAGFEEDDPAIVSIQNRIRQSQVLQSGPAAALSSIKDQITVNLALIRRAKEEKDSARELRLGQEIMTWVQNWNQETGIRCEKCKQIQTFEVNLHISQYYYRSHHLVYTHTDGWDVEVRKEGWTCQE